MPPRINRGGNQHQLDAMKAESNAPKLANPSARFDGTPWSLDCVSVTPGDSACFDAQQSVADFPTGSVSWDMVLPPNVEQVVNLSYSLTFASNPNSLITSNSWSTVMRLAS